MRPHLLLVMLTARTHSSARRRTSAVLLLPLLALVALWWFLRGSPIDLGSAPPGRQGVASGTAAPASAVRFGTPEMASRVERLRDSYARTLSQLPAGKAALPYVTLLGTLTPNQIRWLAEGKPVTLDRMTPQQRRAVQDFEPTRWVKERYRFRRVRVVRLEVRTVAGRPIYVVVLGDLQTGKEITIGGSL